MKVEGEYWGLPTAVRSLALFWNQDLFSEAGLNGPPASICRVFKRTDEER